MPDDPAPPSPIVRRTGRGIAFASTPDEAHKAALETFLSRLTLRSSLDEMDCAALVALPGDEIVTAAHRDIVRPGQVTDYACMVVEGVAGRFDQLGDGKRQITALHIPGDMCDLHSVPVPHTGWGIESLTDTRIKRIPHAVLRDLAARSQPIAMAFWRDTVVDGSILSKWISALGRRSARDRLGHLMCEMGLRFEQAGLGTRTRFDLPITQAQLADVLGLTAVHLNRTMQGLRQEGLLAKDGPTVVIPDFPALAKLAEFDPTYLLLERQR